MELYYQGKDITGHVDIRRCVLREAADGRCDALEVELDHAAAWYGWGPKPGDRIRIRHGGADSGELYVSTILPDNGVFRIWAGSLPDAARRKAWQTYEGMTLQQLLQAGAAECGMQSKLWGLEDNILIPFWMRQNESTAKTMHRLLGLEGVALKVYNGVYTGIGILRAQTLPPAETLTLSPGQRGVEHIRQSGARYRQLRAVTPFAIVTATDAGAEGDRSLTVCDLPATDGITAARWARGMLLQYNRQAESLRVTGMGYRPGLTALSRVDVESSADFTGQWIANEVTHDLKYEQTAVTLLRCLTGIQ